MKKKSLKVGIVGATGLVGQTFLNLLQEKNFPVENLRLFASANSAGKTISFRDQNYVVENSATADYRGLELVFFSAGDDISLKEAPRVVEAGAYVVDNSAAFRMSPDHALVVPEVNGHLLREMRVPTIIANPNCSTIQLVVVLSALKDFGLLEVQVATYQSVSGAGLEAQQELREQTLAGLSDRTTLLAPKIFTKQIYNNAIPQIGSIGEDGFTTEETKVMNETRKILVLPDLKVSAMAVRIPILNVHSEVVWAKFAKPVTAVEVKERLATAVGVHLVDPFPVPSDAHNRDGVFVGRVHQDASDPTRILLWIVSDNLRKGAALNGLQIAEELFLS